MQSHKSLPWLHRTIPRKLDFVNRKLGIYTESSWEGAEQPLIRYSPRSMEFGEKLKRLTQGENKSRIARDAGLSSTAISDYLQKGYIPRADKAVALAHALMVSADWLFDDAKDWPPPDPEAPLRERLSDVPYVDLVREFARRYRLELMDAFTMVTELAAEDWTKAAAAAQKYKSGEKVPPPLAHAISKMGAAVDAATTAITRYNVDVIADFLHYQLPGSEFPLQQLRASELLKRYSLVMKVPGVSDFLIWMSQNLDVLAAMKGAGQLGATIGIQHLLDLLDERKRAELLAQHPLPEE